MEFQFYPKAMVLTNIHTDICSGSCIFRLTFSVRLSQLLLVLKIKTTADIDIDTNVKMLIIIIPSTRSIYLYKHIFEYCS